MSENCPIPLAVRRLAEVHRFWHRAMANYTDPDEYLPDINAAIQAARNCTFGLQKEKAFLEGFDDWYAPWQDTMRNNHVMSWMNDARVKIVHTGDLEAESKTMVRLIMDYYAAAEQIASDLQPSVSGPTPIPPSDGIESELAAPALIKASELEPFLVSQGIPEALLRETTVSVERRWEESSLPGYELSGAVAQNYAFLANLIQAAHVAAGATCHHDYGCDDPMPAGDIDHQPQPPNCMITTRAQRTTSFDLLSGLEEEAGFQREALGDPHFREVGKTKYLPEAGQSLPTAPPDAVTVIDLVPHMVEYAKAILRSGEEHGWFMLFYKGPNLVANRVLAAENPQQKRALAQEMAEVALRSGATGVIEIGEVWMSPETEVEGAILRPADHPQRQEALILHAATLSGLEYDVMIQFERPNGVGEPVVFGEVVLGAGAISNFIAPIKAVWEWRKRTHPSPKGSSFSRSS